MRISLTPTNRLTEWLDASGNKINLSGSVTSKSTKTLKEKFIELTNYMIKNKEPRVIKAEVLKVDDKGFTYKERRSSATAADYELQVIVNYDIGPEHLWQFSIYRNGIYEDTEYGHVGEGWKEFLELLGDYFTVPTKGTAEHRDLCEWLDSQGNKIDLSTSSMSSSSFNIADQTYRFKRLLAQIDSDKSGTYKVDTLTDKILIFTIDTRYRNDIRIELACSVRGNGYLLKVNDKELKCKDYDEVLEFLTATGIINNTDFCESLTLAAEEFLWEEFLNDYIR